MQVEEIESRMAPIDVEEIDSRMAPMEVEETTTSVPKVKAVSNTDLRSLAKDTCLQCVFTYGYWIPGSDGSNGVCLPTKPSNPDTKIRFNISDCLNNKDSPIMNYAWES